MSEYRGTEGHRPYAGAGWYYAAYRDRVSPEFIALLAERLGWQPADQILDLGAGPGQLALLAAPLVARVVALEPEPDMRAEGERRARAQGAGNVVFVAAGSGDLPALRTTFGRFRSALLGQSFHWMTEKARVLQDLSAMVDETAGSIAFVTPRRVSVPPALERAQATVRAILERYIAAVPAGPHPQGRHDPFEEILARSPFPRVETLERTYTVQERPTPEALIGFEYSLSYVLARLGAQRAAFEAEARAALDTLGDLGEVWVTRRDEALVGRR